MTGFPRAALAIGTASFVAGVSVKAAGELMVGAGLQRFDDAVLRAAARARTGWLNATAVDFTSLGSGVLLVLSVLLVGLLLLSTRDLVGAAHLLCASLGAWVLTGAFKTWFARPRPAVIEHLVKVSATGFSYPSGHALGMAAVYFSFAMIARRHLPRHLTRELLIAIVLALIGLVGASRVYLGVHYASDVVAGLLIGVGWSLVLAGLFSLAERGSTLDRRSRADRIASRPA